MQDYYIIRDTINREDLSNILATLIKEQHPNLNVKIVSSKDQKESIKFLNNKIINLDPFTRTTEHYTLDICRVFMGDNQEKPIGYTNRNNSLSIEDQIKNIPNGNYLLVDDDICSGGTINFIKHKINEINPELVIQKELSLIHEILPELREGKVKLFDTIDTHDFFDTHELSGLLIDNGNETKRYLYTHPLVNLKTRAKLTDPELFINKLKML